LGLIWGFLLMHCHLRLVDKIEEIDHNDVNIEWYSDEDSD